MRWLKLKQQNKLIKRSFITRGKKTPDTGTPNEEHGNNCHIEQSVCQMLLSCNVFSLWLWAQSNVIDFICSVVSMGIPHLEHRLPWRWRTKESMLTLSINVTDNVRKIDRVSKPICVEQQPSSKHWLPAGGFILEYMMCLRCAHVTFLMWPCEICHFEKSQSLMNELTFAENIASSHQYVHACC